MKKITLTLFLGLTSLQLISQISQPNNGYTAGNFVGFNATNGINPLLFRTNNINRVRLNGTYGVQPIINGYGTAQGVNTSGYLGISPGTGASLNWLSTNTPFSQLHLVGRNGAFIQGFGFRPWMQTGVTLTDNQDLSYFGLRQVDGLIDVTETVIAWSDNSGATSGPDDMVFRFTGGGGNTTTNTNFEDVLDVDGRHVARYTGSGLYGLGNTFGINTSGTLYNTPRSHFHMSQQYLGGPANELWGFQQITYRRPDGSSSDIIGQGELETDGLRFGIDNDIFSTGIYQHLDGFLRWQEASSFVIQTEDNTAANIQANERMRITSVGALALNFPPATYIGLTTPTPVTRIGVSHNGSTGLTRPMSLMHLGYNIGGTFGPLTL